MHVLLHDVNTFTYTFWIKQLNTVTTFQHQLRASQGSYAMSEGKNKFKRYKQGYSTSISVLSAQRPFSLSASFSLTASALHTRPPARPPLLALLFRPLAVKGATISPSLT